MLWLILLLFLPLPAFAQSPAVKITNFSSNDLPEWVELHNESGNTIDLTNWAIGDSNMTQPYDIGLSGCLSPNAYFTVFSDSNWLNNDGDIIYLYDASRNLVDTFTYTTGRFGTDSRSDNTCQITPTTSPTTIPTAPPTQSPTSFPTPSPTPVSSLTIDTAPSSVRVLDEFSVSFTGQNLIPGKEYYFKVYGGTVDDFGFETKNGSTWYEFNSSTSNFPRFTASEGPLSQSILVRAKDNKPLGLTLLKMKFKEINSSDWTSASNEKSLTILAALPTSTPTLTPTPTKVPTLTPTRLPTATPLPTLVLPTPLPTPDNSLISDTPFPTIDLNIHPASSSEEVVLGDIIISPTPAPGFRFPKTSGILPYIVISVGSLMLLVPIFISKIVK